MAGYLLHQDEERIVIVTGVNRPSANEKTGDMLQIWILAAAQSPIDTVALDLDAIICGDCVHGGNFGERSCYVTVSQAPQQIWKAWQRGSYPFLPRRLYPDIFAGKMIRWGAYGDPAFVPTEVLYWANFTAAGWTGYTHQRRKADPALRNYFMASVDSQDEYLEAKAAGWRTFRTRTRTRTRTTEPLGLGEIDCPASDQSGHRTTCSSCGLCNGVRYLPDPRKDISIVLHGSWTRNFVPMASLLG